MELSEHILMAAVKPSLLELCEAVFNGIYPIYGPNLDLGPDQGNQLLGQPASIVGDRHGIKLREKISPG